MHGLPDGAAFHLECGDGFRDLLGAALSAYAVVKIILLSADHGGHGVLIDQAAGKPEVGLAVFRVVGVHGDGEVLHAFSVALVDSFLPQEKGTVLFSHMFTVSGW